MMNCDKIGFAPDGRFLNSEDFQFTVKCNKCGDEHVRVFPKHVYDSSLQEHDYITLNFLCPTCHNSVETVIDDNRKK